MKLHLHAMQVINQFYLSCCWEAYHDNGILAVTKITTAKACFWTSHASLSFLSQQGTKVGDD